MPRSSHSRRQSSSSTQPRASAPKIEITINVYDLLPPGRLSSVLWTVGSGLLHSGVVIRGREFAYGGHNHRGVSGVYWSRPGQEPPGGTFRCDILHGVTYRNDKEIEDIVQEVSDKYLGPSYNLLTQNCNHFTSALCEALTSKPAPAWLNRAAGIGVALPCMVPKEWVTPPDVDTADGELLANAENDTDSQDEDEDEDSDERSGMMESQRRRQHRAQATGSRSAKRVADKDSSGRDLPIAERAPI